MKKVKIEILTTNLGCAKCESAIKKVKDVAGYFKNLEIIKTDISKNPKKIIENNIMSTPAIFLNDKLEFEGSVNELTLKNKILDAGGIQNE